MSQRSYYYCCTDEVRDYLLNMGNTLKTVMPELSLKTIYTALILTAYSLLADEDLINTKYIDDESMNLYMRITGGSIPYGDRDLASEIRRYFFGFRENTQVVGGKRNLNKKSKKRKSHVKKSIRKNRNRKA